MTGSPEDEKETAQGLSEENHPGRSKRAARACARCHSRKVRCDGSITGFPCTNCRLDGRSCTLHSGKREKEKQLLRVIGRERRTSYPTPAMTPGQHPLPSNRQTPELLQARSMVPSKVSFVKSQAILRVPIQDVLDVFTRHYFLYVHPCLPVIDEAEFWRKYRCPDGSSGRISVLLFQAMLFAASPYVPVEVARQCGYDSLLSAREDLYQRAKRLYESGIEKDRLLIAQACLLLAYFSTDAIRSTNTKWLKIAIKYAKKERAHMYYCAPSQTGRKTSDLKRLWWCCLIRDRIISLGMRRPIQIMPDEFDLQQPGLSFEDLKEETLHSEVYNPDTKIALCRALASLCHLVVAVTDLIIYVYPTTPSVPCAPKDRRMELNRLEETKLALLGWELSWVVYPDGKEFYIHPSLALFTNLIAIYYQSARIALCNRICLLIGNTVPSLEETERERIEICYSELVSAIRATADNVKQLILNGVADKLPISAVAYTMLPHILLSIQSQLSTTPEDKQSHEVMLVFFVEIFRCFRSQYSTQLILAATWKALELCQQRSIEEDLSTNNPKSYTDAQRPSKPYPSLFELRLTEYIQILSYVDEFLSLRRTPIAEVFAATPGTDMYNYYHHHQQGKQQPPSGTEEGMSVDYPGGVSTSFPAWMEALENFYLGQGDLWTSLSGNSPDQEAQTESEPEVKAKPEPDDGQPFVSLDGFCFEGDGDIQMNVGQSDESFQNMLACLPLLGE